MTANSTVFDSGQKKRIPSMSLRRRILSYLKTPVIGASIVALMDLLGLQLLSGSTLKTTLVLVMFLEGAVGLIAGSAIALSSTPSISKSGEIMFGTAPWSREGERNAERVAGKWFIASTFMILTGFALSVI
jgi:hypothetical protein